MRHQVLVHIGKEQAVCLYPVSGCTNHGVFRNVGANQEVQVDTIIPCADHSVFADIHQRTVVHAYTVISGQQCQVFRDTFAPRTPLTLMPTPPVRATMFFSTFRPAM